MSGADAVVIPLAKAEHDEKIESFWGVSWIGVSYIRMDRINIDLDELHLIKEKDMDSKNSKKNLNNDKNLNNGQT